MKIGAGKVGKGGTDLEEWAQDEGLYKKNFDA